MPTFLSGENRYADLMQTMPDEAKVLQAELQSHSDEVYKELTDTDCKEAANK